MVCSNVCHPLLGASHEHSHDRWGLLIYSSYLLSVKLVFDALGSVYSVVAITIERFTSIKQILKVRFVQSDLKDPYGSLFFVESSKRSDSRVWYCILFCRIQLHKILWALHQTCGSGKRDWMLNTKVFQGTFLNKPLQGMAPTSLRIAF